MKQQNINQKVQLLMINPSHQKNIRNNSYQKQKQTYLLGTQSQIADQGNPFSQQLQNIEVQLNKQNKEQFRNKNTKPQLYTISHHHNLSLLSKNKENLTKSLDSKEQLFKQSNPQSIIQNSLKIAKIQDIKNYQMRAKMSRAQQSYKDIPLMVRNNESFHKENNTNKRQTTISNSFKLNTLKDLMISFKYQFDGTNSLKESLVPNIFLSNKQSGEKISNQKEQQLNVVSQKLLMMVKKNKYLLNIPLNFDQVQYFLKIKANLQRNCGICISFVNKHKQKSKNFRYEIVKLMPNVIRLRCLILIDNKTEKIWKQLQIPIIHDPNIHIPDHNTQHSLLQVNIHKVSFSHSIIKLNNFQINLILQHPYQDFSYLFIETDSNGVQIKYLSLEGIKCKKQRQINIGGCQGECKII